jgi:hypothetical protein
MVPPESGVEKRALSAIYGLKKSDLMGTVRVQPRDPQILELSRAKSPDSQGAA